MNLSSLFFAPSEDEPGIEYSTPLCDWLCVAGGLSVAAIVVGCVAWVGIWAWRHM